MRSSATRFLPTSTVRSKSARYPSNSNLSSTGLSKAAARGASIARHNRGRWFLGSLQARKALEVDFDENLLRTVT